ncbi:holin family protein [Marimonas lutisalis]|uniref:holin family protein n=1 Tax=Marimonas lutisalis TaxID=2545756 RepID=UPI0018771142|nr:holin family protein [Marimonas lutisalis]
MGMIERIFTLVFGDGGRGVHETVEVFRENAEAAATRSAEMQAKALEQFAGEFEFPKRGLFDRVMDAVNRLPRPALALGTLGLFIAAMVDPVWFAARMQGIALVPEPLWWLLGAIVSFYFGARHQAKGQEFQRQITRTLASVPAVVDNLERLDAVGRHAESPGAADTRRDADLTLEAMQPGPNPALRAWQRGADLGR